MSKVLVIEAHPDTDKFSSSLTLGKTFLDAYQEAHPDDEITVHNVSVEMNYPLNATALAIYHKTIDRKPLSEPEQLFEEGRQKWLDEFISADKYVFINPMYNLFIPAEMKSYFDLVMQVPYTFVYTPEGNPQGVLKHKKAIHLQSAGGFYHGESGHPDLSFLDMADTYVKTILSVMGVTDYQALFVEGMDHEPEHAETIETAAFDKAEELAKTF
ncbi:FMN-dependent NADH-azoreductase [Sporolactobacillus vineae]|uniref:FMN-dependent NADH-azoreductase n=1 Tax=Sporolactobacillus vineae TaxID=444463 RepID=UPI000289443B|nr:NAD(P)H-dependent oxidoreductase [Sporolactobacillus vineae]